MKLNGMIERHLVVLEHFRGLSIDIMYMPFISPKMELKLGEMVQVKAQ
jgi:hypothetical protein